MADVFLSYAHADRAVAQRLADDLVATGLSVWLDREIHGGAEFSRMIESEIAAARHVVVLWSADSIESRWVRDEASLALDAGKLVPVSIGGAIPPLGFRQLQAVPLDDWVKRRGNALPNALARALAMEGPVTPPEPAPRSRRRRKPLWAAVAALLALVAASAWWFFDRRGHAGAKVLEVAPLKIDAGDEAARVLQQSLANDLTRLVIGHDAQLNFVEAGDQPDLRKADYVLTGDAGTSGGRLHATVRLTNAGDGIILWSRDFDGEAAAIAPLRQRIAVRVADVLLCALGSRSKRPDDIDLSTLRLFLSGCENMHPEADADWHVARDLFAQVVERRPDFAQARALYAASLTLTVGAYGTLPRSEWSAVRQQAREEARRALEQDRSLGDAWFAIVNSHGYAERSEKMEAIEAGLKADPDSALLHNSRAVMLSNIGFPAGSLAELQKSREGDPFAPLSAANMIEALAYSGKLREANDLLAESLVNWPDQFYIRQTGFDITARLGDPRKALAQLDDPVSYHPPQADLWRNFLLARIEGTPQASERFVRETRSLFAETDDHAAMALLHSLVQLGRIDDAYALALSRPRFPPDLDYIWFLSTMAPFRADLRFPEIVKRQGLAPLWHEDGLVPEFCQTEKLRYRCDFT